MFSVARVAACLTAALSLGLAAAAPAATVNPDSLRWGQQATPGPVLSLVQVGRVLKRDDRSVTYVATAERFPRGKTYTLYGRGLRTGVQLLGTGFTANDSGFIYGADHKPIEKREMKLRDYLPGEAYEAALISTDGAVRVFTWTFPYGIYDNKGGAKAAAKGTAKGAPAKRGAKAPAKSTAAIWARLLDLKGNRWSVEGQGFRPGEKLVHCSITGQGAATLKDTTLVVGSDGKFATTVAVAVAGQPGGISVQTIDSKSGNFKLGLPWGKRLEETH